MGETELVPFRLLPQGLYLATLPDANSCYASRDGNTHLMRSWGSAGVTLTGRLEWRKRLICMVRRKQRSRGIAMSRLYALWGRTMGSKTARVTHPLLCHMIDVAKIVGALWDCSLGDGMRKYLTGALDCDDVEARSTLMFWAALHDLGKASPALQRRFPPAIPVLEAQGLSFKQQFADDDCGWHGLISAWALPPPLEVWGAPRLLARDLARGLGGHHGSWPPPGFTCALNRDHCGDDEWNGMRAELAATLAELDAPTVIGDRLGERAHRQSLVMLVSGLLSAADWVGSMSQHFAAAPGTQNIEVYAGQAAAIARRAIGEISFDVWQPPQEPVAFETLFSGFTPHASQQSIIDLAPELDGPALVLIEAPTGSGKTESALYLADYWAQTLQQRGLYIGMPTTATSNQMHSRLCRMLDARYGEGYVEPLVVHSQARWVGAPPEITVKEAADGEQPFEGLKAEM